MERAGLARLLGGGVATHGGRPVMIAESDPEKFRTAFARAVAGSAEIFLCDPGWGAVERAQVEALLRAGTGPGSGAEKLPRKEGGWLMIPTGGTSGRVRFARHDAATLAAAVRGFTRHFSIPQVNAVGLLPLHHVSGLMGWMRCALTGGEYRPLEWKAIEAGALPAMSAKPHGWVISLVPTQLGRLLRSERTADWLANFRTILLGGGPAWPGLLEQAARRRLPLAPGYGMTESAAMVAALRSEEFLAGARSCGAVLPHVTLKIGEEGAISIGGDSLFRGYYPDWRTDDEYMTSDAGWLDERGHLHVTGRRDSVIITGGEKVDPVEVEAVLRGSGEFIEVVVLGMPDAEWGQVVIAAYPETERPNLDKVQAAITRLLSPAKRPKRFVAVANWPANSQGKVNRAEVARRASLNL